MIDYIIIPNLKRRKDKWHIMVGALLATGFPVRNGDMFIRFNAYDGLSYRDTDAVVDAAIADGFPCFDAFYKKYDEQADIAWTWTWISVIREIANRKDKIGLYIIDDFFPAPGWNWNRITGLVSEASRLQNYDFRGLQYCRHIFPSTTRTLEPYTSMLQKEFLGTGDMALALSDKGAKILLDEFLVNPLNPPHSFIEHICRLGTANSKFSDGFWHTLEDVFICYTNSDRLYCISSVEQIWE